MAQRTPGVEVGAVAAAVVLAGGGARRLGGVDKLTLTVDGVALLDRVLAAIADAGWPAVVVGPPRVLAQGLPEPTWIGEDPPGGGPAYALAVAVGSLSLDPPEPGRAAGLVAVLAGDLPHLTGKALREVADAGARAVSGGRTGAMAVDGAGRDQLLLGVWSLPALRRGLAGVTPGTSMRTVFATLGADRVRLAGDPPPWTDCDTAADLAEARRAGGRVRGRPALPPPGSGDKVNRVTTGAGAAAGSGGAPDALGDWVAAVRAELDLPESDVAALLDLARDVAHQVTRPAAPVTCFLVGLAAGRDLAAGSDAAAAVTAAAERVAGLLPGGADHPGQ